MTREGSVRLPLSLSHPGELIDMRTVRVWKSVISDWPQQIPVILPYK